MRVFGLGPTELVIILIILSVNVIPGWAMFRIADRAGYVGGSRWLWAIAYMFTGWIAIIVFALSDWPLLQRLRVAMPAPEAPGAPTDRAGSV